MGSHGWEKEFACERILFVVDIAPETSSCDLLIDSKITRLDLVKQAICNFLVAKNTLSKEHKFAIATLTDEIQLLTQFQTNEDLADTLSCIEPSTEQFITADLSKLEEQVLNATAGEENSEDCIYRVILVYSRSSTFLSSLPKLPSHYYFDAIYIHDKPAQGNRVAAIWTSIQAMEPANGSYLFETSCNLRYLFHAFANLLANAKQRVPQDAIEMKY